MAESFTRVFKNFEVWWLLFHYWVSRVTIKSNTFSTVCNVYSKKFINKLDSILCFIQQIGLKTLNKHMLINQFMLVHL